MSTIHPPVLAEDDVLPMEVNVDEFLSARADARVKALLKDAAAEGARVKGEGRQRWSDEHSAA